MDLSSIKTENGKVSCETPEGTVVNVTINQRSALDCLLDTFRFFRDMKRSGQKTKPSRMSSSAAHLGFGVAYISLGLVSVMLAIIFCIAQPYLSIFYSGVHFWVGFPFLVSGLLNLVAYRFPNIWWRTLAFISLLVNFGVSIGGLVLTVDDTHRFYWMGPDEQACYNLVNGRGYYRATSGYNDYELQRCLDGIRKYKFLIKCLTYMTLVIMIWGLCMAILSVGMRVKSFWSSCKLEKTDQTDDALIAPVPTDDIIIA
ncbi:uncharacterized protein LOC122941779 isoform X2 [Bufo gargarizans]|nr:uncharacterized protein LOC122941779 isoform X2 [Bufo gargarizans]XP_044155149.1 uncharacterized protein LOC122941779 isoform X2 [Bufo gargarizans]